MTYDEYVIKVRSDISRFRASSAWIKKHGGKLAAATAAAILTVLAVMLVSGIFTKKLSCENYVYGDTPQIGAKALFSRVDYSYESGAGEKEGVPYLAGEYTVRARTVNGFGAVREQESAVTVMKRRASVLLNDTETVYGDECDFLKNVSCDNLREGDRIESAEVDYDRLKGGDGVITSVVIRNENGEDVTGCYDLTLGFCRVTVLRRTVVITTASAEKTYDGEILYDNSYTADGSLAPGDELRVVFDASITKPGSVKNTATARVYHGDEDRTALYRIRFSRGTLTVKRRVIRVKTGSAEKAYDGLPLSCGEYELDGSELLPGHEAGVLSLPKITDAGEVKNIIEFYVKDENGANVRDLYDFQYDPGELRINKIKLAVKSEDKTVEYDGTAHIADKAQIVSGTPLEGHSVTFTEFYGARYAGEYKNTFKALVVDDAEGTNVTRNYDIEYEFGTFTVTPRKINVAFDVTGNPGVSTSFTVICGTEQEDSRPAGAAEQNLPEPYSYEKSYSGLLPDESLEFPSQIPFEVGNDELETYINDHVRVLNRNGRDITDSYEIVISYRYDPALLDEVRRQDPSHGGDDSTDDTQTGPSGPSGPGTSDDTDGPEDPRTPEEIAAEKYGPSGIGSSGVGGGIKNSPSVGASVPGSEQDYDESTVLGTVISSSFEGGVYLRLRSFGGYTGTGWAESPIYEDAEKMGTHPLNLLYENLSRTYYAINDITVKYNVNDGLFPVPYYTKSPLKSSYTVTDIAIPEDKAGTTRKFSHIPMPTTQNVLSSAVRSLSYADDDYYVFVRENYLEVPESIKKDLLKFIEKNGLDAASPTVITDVASFLRSYATYDGAFDPAPEGADRVMYFLNESREGICAHFASAATLIYRALGIPARFTVGYYVVAREKDETRFYPKDAHSWPEVYVENLGWVPVEVTASRLSQGGENSEFRPPAEGSAMFYNRINYSLISAEKTYDGEPLYSAGVRLEAGSNLLPGHRIEYEAEGLTYAGSVQIRAKKAFVLDENGNDVTDKYVLNQIFSATLTVYPVYVVLPEIRLYVGETVTLPEYESISDAGIAALVGVDRIVLDYEADGTMTMDENGAVTGVAASNKREFKKEFELGKIKTGEIMWQNAEVIVSQKVTVVEFENVRYAEGEPPEDHEEGLIRVTGENGKMYTYIAVRSADAAAKFSGRYLTAEGCTIVAGELEPGHKLVFSSGAAGLYVGSVKNGYGTLTVTDEKGADVTDEYIIDFYPGTITVTEGDYEDLDAQVTVAADGKVDLSRIEWISGLTGIDVRYDAENASRIARVDGNTLIGISPGKADIKAYMTGVDLNGDGVYEFGTAERKLTVTVTPGGGGRNPVLYLLFAVSLSAAAAALVFVAFKVTEYRKEETE